MTLTTWRPPLVAPPLVGEAEPALWLAEEVTLVPVVTQPDVWHLEENEGAGLNTGILSRRIWRMARLGPIYSIITPGAGSCYYPDAGHSPHHHNGQHVQNQGFMTKPWLNFNQIEIYDQGQSAPSQNWCEIQFGTDIVHWLFNWRGRVETN